ncbi:hypothetical protein [Ramlibacter sp.]|uniref:hypothetical protein n=1 Tax=Ramlibacter sp. TaxID=1917967 RepID=UPI002BD94C7E|nr:hypothetical protein [Ramlibacter sp.]HWI84104.1 hypothetical protein [Ramlibacter sp.]
MDQASDTAQQATARPEAGVARSRRLETLVTRLAACAVAVAGVSAAYMQTRYPAQPKRAEAPAPSAVVQAPPLSRPGAAAAGICPDCGVIERVVARGPAADSAAYEMRIRMDDGSLRTVAQRGALPSGSRVLLAGRSILVLSDRPGRG